LEALRHEKEPDFFIDEGVWFFFYSINPVNCNKKELSPNDMEKALMCH